MVNRSSTSGDSNKEPHISVDLTNPRNLRRATTTSSTTATTNFASSRLRDLTDRRSSQSLLMKITKTNDLITATTSSTNSSRITRQNDSTTPQPNSPKTVIKYDRKSIDSLSPNGKQQKRQTPTCEEETVSISTPSKRQRSSAMVAKLRLNRSPNVCNVNRTSTPLAKDNNNIQQPKNITPDQQAAGSTSSESSHPQATIPQTHDSNQAASAIDIQDKTYKVLIGVTGSVAAIKLVELIKKIKSVYPKPYTINPTELHVEVNLEIRIVMTTASKHFIPKEEIIETFKEDSTIKIYDDADEWSQWNKMSDPVLHIELRKWADMFLIAPLDANTMGKMANGICDNLLTCIIRAWDVTKPLVYCPAMNVHMYNHPLTKEHLCKLQSFGYIRIDAVEKRLACGDYGMGGMASVETITNKVIECLTQPTTKKTSIGRSFINQTPTYPIITKPEVFDAVGQAMSNQILDRIKMNSQITIHPVPNANCDRAPTNNNNFRNQKAPDHSIPNGFPLSRVRGQSLLNGNRNLKSKPNVVTSLQNLKAMGTALNNDNGSIDFDDADSEHNSIFNNNNNNNNNNILTADSMDEFEESDFDPSRLLLQSMITDDLELDMMPTSNNNTINRNSIDRPKTSTSSSAVNDNYNKMISPLLNTSKFLTLCYDKERDCFTCTICKHDYKNRKSMARHLKEQHVQGNIYACTPCGVSYKRREKLIKHNRERHPEII